MSTVSVLVVGLLLGLQHATEADHLAAVATLAAQQGSVARTLRQGVAWGLGHALTLAVFAGAVVVLGQTISPGLEQALEKAVGVMLALLGMDLLWRLWRDRIHFHVHGHAGETGDHAGTPPLHGSTQVATHIHVHSHRGESGPHARSLHRHVHPAHGPLRAVAVGMMHGLAGSAALVLLSLESAPTIPIGLGYIALFGTGSMLGMAGLSIVIALPLRASAKRLLALHHTMQLGVGAASIVIGLTMVAEIGWLAWFISA
jgi:ABC-type nickel/cobalt efflux system permease component RcnA